MNPQLLWDWMIERQSIYLRRQLNPDNQSAWTSDPIFQQYSFCNVFREQDRVTQWIKQYIREPFADHRNLWFLLCVARQINWPHTLSALLTSSGLPDCWYPHRACNILLRRQAEGHKVYTGAYMLRGDIQKNDGTSNDKPTYTCFKVLDPVYVAVDNMGVDPMELGHPLSSSIQSATEYLDSFHGWGGFLAYEVATDLRHTRYLRDAPDVMTWANPGPGAKRGLNRIFGREVKKALPRKQAMEEIQQLLEMAIKVMPGWMAPRTTGFHRADDLPLLEMRDIEHSLCEMDKYQRVLLGEGRPRATFKPQKENWLK